jgi:hypothetical protein
MLGNEQTCNAWLLDEHASFSVLCRAWGFKVLCLWLSISCLRSLLAFDPSHHGSPRWFFSSFGWDTWLCLRACASKVEWIFFPLIWFHRFFNWTQNCLYG